MAALEDTGRSEEEEEEEEEDWNAPLPVTENVEIEHDLELTTADATLIATGSDDSPYPKSQERSVPKPASTTSITAEAVNKDGLMSRMQLNDTKAGMQGLDKEKINKIIYEASKGSRFYENEMKKERQVSERIEEHKRRLASVTPEQIKTGVAQADQILKTLEASRDLSRTIVHVDMDMFYAAVEMRDNPALRNVPMAVGSNSMLSTSNYMARRFGVRAAMPGFIGRKLCPDLVIVPCHFDKYTAVSKQIRAVMADYDPGFCPMSLDEAYLDMTQHLAKRAEYNDGQRTFQVMLSSHEICSCDKKTAEKNKPQLEKKVGPGSLINQETNDSEEPNKQESPNKCAVCSLALDESLGKVETFGLSAEEAVREMRARIHWETKLTASAGIAPNTMVAKVCSDQNKPNGQYFLPSTRDSVLTFIKNLDIRKVSGIGKVAARMLYSLDINTCSDLYTKRGVLYHLYSETSFQYFLRIALGIGSTRVERDGERKSMSTERTFSEINDPKELYEKCHELSVSLAEDLEDDEIVGKTVGIKLKTVNFTLMTRAQTLRNPTSDAEQIYAAARELLRTEIIAAQPEPLRLRLMGVRMSNLMPKSEAGDQKQKTITSFISRMKAAKPPNSDIPKDEDSIDAPVRICDPPNTESEETSVASQVPKKPKLRVEAPKPKGNILSLLSNMKSKPVMVKEEETCPTEGDNTERQSASNTKLQSIVVNKEGTSAKTVANPKGSICSLLSNMKTRPPSPSPPTNVSPASVSAKTDHNGNEKLPQQSAPPFMSGSANQISYDAQQKVGEKSKTGTNVLHLRSGRVARKAAKTYTCPVCSGVIEAPNLDTFNQHIDECLAGGMVQDPAQNVEPVQGDSGKECVDEQRQRLSIKEMPRMVTEVPVQEEVHLDERKVHDNIKRQQGKNLETDYQTGLEEEESSTHDGKDIGFKTISDLEQLRVRTAPTPPVGTDTKCGSSEIGSISLPTLPPKSGLVQQNVQSASEISMHDKVTETVVLVKMENDGIKEEQKGSEEECELPHMNSETESESEEERAESSAMRRIQNKVALKGKVHQAEPSTSHQGTDQLLCPVCNKLQTPMDLTAFNRHVDECLNQGLIMDNTQASPQPSSTNLVSQQARSGTKGSGGQLSSSRSFFAKKMGDKLKSANKSSGSQLKPKTPAKPVVKKPQTSPAHNSLHKAGDIGSQSATQSKTKSNSENLTMGYCTESQDVLLTCPVCELSQEWVSADTFSRHVDACLNRVAIKEMLDDEGGNIAQPLSQTTQNKRPLASPTEDPALKKKKTLGKGFQRIDSFFKH